MTRNDKSDKFSMAAVRVLEIVGRPGTITDAWIRLVADIIRDELGDSIIIYSASEIADNADRQAESEYSHSDGAHER